jgi:5'-nucleotidase
MVLGNHEFDDEIDGLTPFLDTLKTPIIVANIDDSEEARLHGKYEKFIIVEKSGRKIGIIGVINGKTNVRTTAPPGY